VTAAPPTRVVLNGRFLSQAVTGVQRTAREMVRALDGLVGAGEPEMAGLSLEVVAPRGAAADLELAHIPIRREGRGRGHAWEQLVLPTLVGRHLLVSFANMGPLAVRRQLVVVHDTGVWSVPYAYGAAFRGWYRTVTPALARRAQAVVTVSEFSRGELAKHVPLTAGAVTVVPNGGDHLAAIAADDSVLGRHKLAPGRYVLTVGSGAAHKNLAALARAMAAPELAELQLVAVGAGAARVFAPADAAAAGDAHAVSLGRVTDGELRALYQNALCLVIPSRYEGFGLPAVEAMSCECPVLAARAGALPEVCGDGALYFDPDDSAALSRLLARLAQDAAARADLATRGARRARLYSWRDSARALARRIGEEASR